jgi:hypothetical protein
MTSWEVIILPAHQLADGSDAPKITLSVDTSDPDVLALIEEQAREHGVVLERQP